VKFDSASVLDVVNKHSARGLGITAVVFCSIGGIGLGRGIEELIHTNGRFGWIASTLMGSAFLAYGAFWVVMLVRRAQAGAMPVDSLER
jgi:hypothetical protein